MGRALRDDLGDIRASTLSFWALVLVVISSVMLIGGVHAKTMLGIGVLSSVAALLALVSARAPRPSIPLPAAVMFALAAYSALQALPLPAAIVSTLSPQAYDIWAHALDPLEAPAPGWMRLSVDPGASLLEALKWASYGAVFIAAAAASARRGVPSVALVVFGAAVLVALVTLAHGLTGAERVFGVYEPRFGPSRWNVGPLLNPNNLVGYLNVGILIGLGILAMPEPPLPRWVLALGVVTLLGVGIVSGSRGGVVALAFGLAVTLILIARTRRRRGPDALAPAPILVATIGAAVFGGAALALLASSDRTWIALYDTNVEKLRLSDWARPLIADFPIFGVGRGAFESVFPAYRMGRDDLIFTHVENFPVQWVVEWGLPVGLAALVVFAIALRPRQLGATRDPLAAGCYAAFLALVLHNLVDLGFEIPAIPIALCALLGACWGVRLVELVPGTKPLRRAAPLAVALCLLLVASAAWGLSPVAHERLAISRQYVNADFDNPQQVTALRDRIVGAMRRHPAEPYFPRLGALVAFRSRDQNPLPWINRALERAMWSGRSHFLLARILASRGAASQAMLELRLSVENDPGLALSAARAALRISQDYERLLQVVPAGAAGANMLVSLARAAQAPKLSALHVAFLREAVRRDGSDVRARTALSRALIESLAGRSNGPICAEARRAPCIQEVERNATAVSSADQLEGTAIRARLRAALGDASAAVELLSAECERHPHRKRVPCLRVTADLAASGELSLYERALDALIDAGCSVDSDCIETYVWAATIFERKGDWLGALTYRRRAAREDPSASNWNAVARTARKLGLAQEARTAEARARGR